MAPGVTVAKCFIFSLKSHFPANGYFKGKESKGDLLKTFICLVNRAASEEKKNSCVSTK